MLSKVSSVFCWNPRHELLARCQVTKALDALLVGLSDVAKKASEELGEGATEAQIVDRTIKLFLGIQPLVGRGLGPEPLNFLHIP